MVKAAFSLAWDAIVLVATGYIEQFKAVWAPLSAFYSALWGAVSIAAKFMWDGLIRTATDYYNAFLAVWRPLATFFSGLWDSIANAFMSAMGWVIDKLSGVMANIKSAIAFVQGIGHGTIDLALGGGEPGSPQESGPQVISPSERAGSSSQFSGELSVRAEPGTSASVISQSGGGMSLKLAPSGGF
jgi:hypothetical protein